MLLTWPLYIAEFVNCSLFVLQVFSILVLLSCCWLSSVCRSFHSLQSLSFSLLHTHCFHCLEVFCVFILAFPLTFCYFHCSYLSIFLLTFLHLSVYISLISYLLSSLPSFVFLVLLSYLSCSFLVFSCRFASYFCVFSVQFSVQFQFAFTRYTICFSFGLWTTALRNLGCTDSAQLLADFGYHTQISENLRYILKRFLCWTYAVNTLNIQSKRTDI